MVNLAVFPGPLAHLILCGGGGLPPAYGPLQRDSGWSRDKGVWGGSQLCGMPALMPDAPFVAPENWLLPLDPASPWPARLAVVAAWMLDYDEPYAAVDLRGMDDPGRVGLSVVGTLIATWEASDGKIGIGGTDGTPSLPTLPAHLATHPPVVALLLALYDVPEIRARVETLGRSQK